MYQDKVCTLIELESGGSTIGMLSAKLYIVYSTGWVIFGVYLPK